jgi:hypothetical protein
MPQRLDQIVARVEDPANPVVWLDPSTGEDIWQALPGALKQRGFAVVLLDGVRCAETLRLELLGVLGGGPSLREALSMLEWAGVKQGWAILFRRPEALREADEAAFEDLLETVAQVHEVHWQQRRGHLKLVVTD